MTKKITGFSKLSKSEKIDCVVSTYFSGDTSAKSILEQYWNNDKKLQQLHDEFIENNFKPDIEPRKKYEDMENFEKMSK